MPPLPRLSPSSPVRNLRAAIAALAFAVFFTHAPAQQSDDPDSQPPPAKPAPAEQMFELKFDPPPEPPAPTEPETAEAADALSAEAPAPAEPAVAAGYPRAPVDWLETQIALSRVGFSSGPIDGVFGTKTKAALEAYQESNGIPVTGRLDENVVARLTLDSEPLETYTISDADIVRLQPVSDTWLGKSRQSALDYETLLELVAERARASTRLVQRLNPDIDFETVAAGTIVNVPATGRPVIDGAAAHVHIKLADRVLQVRDQSGRLIAHFPVSIAQRVEKRPVGELRVTVLIPDPDYTFDPANFPESEEGRELGRRLMIPPGPNNPVGVAWIGLSRPGYGIHGTPHPERVGRTESHGCFRLANWDARTLLSLAWDDLPVFVDP